MSAAVRSYLLAGMAMVGAGVVTAAQTVPPTSQAETRVVERAVILTAAGQPCSGYYIDGCDIWAPQTYTPITVDRTGSVLNIPANILNAIVSIPRAYLDGLNDLSYGLEVTGSWWVYTPTNVLGFDPADPPKVAGLMNLAIPFKALSQPLGEGLTWWAKANLPMNASCTGTAGPVCPDLGPLLESMFLEPVSFLASGWKFPRVFDPVSELEGSMGNPLPPDYPGNVDREVPWSGAYIQLNPFDPEYSVINYLTADPKTNRPEPITFAEVTFALKRFAKAVKLDFYPFVPMSFLLKGWPYTAATPLFKPFLPWLCKDCNPLNPAWPPGATEQPWPSSTAPAPTAAAPVAAEASGTDGLAVPAAAAPRERAAGAGDTAVDRVLRTVRAKRAQPSAARTAAAADAVQAGDSKADDVQADDSKAAAAEPAAVTQHESAAADGGKSDRGGRSVKSRASAGSRR